MNQFLAFYEQFMELSKINPVMSGIIGVWVATVFTWSMRNVPMRLWDYIKHNSMRHADIPSSTASGDNNNYQYFNRWIAERPSKVYSRILQLVYMANKEYIFDSIIVPGYGRHYFIYKKRLWWYSKSVSEQQQGTNNVTKEELRITGLFVSDALLRELLEEFAFHPKLSDKNWCYLNSSGDGWLSSELHPRSFDTIAIDPLILNSILHRIDRYLVSGDFYRQQGIPNKLGIELVGPPGTGKTSIVRALAAHYNRRLYVISLNEISSGKELLSRLLELEDYAFVLFEDYDSLKALWSREHHQPSATIDAFENKLGLSLQGFLNAIDGIIPLEKLVLFYTTNNPEVIDSAVRRKGRMDVSYVIDAVDHDIIVQYVRAVAPTAKLPIGNNWRFKPIKGNELSALLIANHDDHQAFVDSIPKEIVVNPKDTGCVVENTPTIQELPYVQKHVKQTIQ